MDKRNILLVDDTRLYLEQEKSFLSGYDFEVSVAHNGLQALKIINEEMPDMVFMDLYMPDMDGDRCCYVVKADERLRHIPIVMVTQGANDEDFERCWHAGCNDIIAKPINRHYFLAVAKRHLNIHQRRFPRYLARLRIQYQCGDDRNQVLANYCVNLSTGGIFLETTSLLAVGVELKIEFILPENRRAITCTGRVAWLNHPQSIKNQNLPVGMGLQFIDLSLDDMDSIRRFIKNQGLTAVW